jgi:hypothetical protein
MTVTFKDLKKKKNQLGQFMTPDTISQDMVDNNNYTGLIIEPSFGLGSFLHKLESKYPTNPIIGIEYDPELYDKYTGPSVVINQSFYQFQLPEGTVIDSISFVGNPPYRTPAFSLTSDDRNTVKALIKKYKLTGVKEEAVFFIAHAVDIIKAAGVPGVIHWVLPKTIFENSSSAFKNFRKFLNTHAPAVDIIDISEKYPDVAQPLCIAKFLVNQSVSNNITDSLVLKDTIEFQEIFNRTYLGSVPCESILLSSKGESLSSFRKRLVKIFLRNEPLKTGLLYNNEYHLRALSGTSAKEKFDILDKYVSEIKQKINLIEFAKLRNYKSIAHRNEVRWYFRNQALTNVSFIYIINSNPCESFYFPGNPTKTSTDYFGFCDYDINRNSSPGANRTIPVKDIEKNITLKFKKFWTENTSAPITEIFNYILYISKSSWYKEYKSKYQRFYFGIPKDFDKTWKPELNKTGKNWNSIEDIKEPVIEKITKKPLKIKTPTVKKEKLLSPLFEEAQ